MGLPIDTPRISTTLEQDAHNVASEMKSLLDEITQPDGWTAENQERLEKLQEAKAAIIKKQDLMKSYQQLATYSAEKQESRPVEYKSLRDQAKDVSRVMRGGAPSSAYTKTRWHQSFENLNTINEIRTAQKALSGAVGADAGFLIEPQFYPDILGLEQLDEELSIVRAHGAEIVPTQTRTVNVAVIDQDSTDTTQNNIYGGMVAYWDAEADNMTQSQPSFKNIRIDVEALNVYTIASREVLEDAGRLEAFLMDKFPRVALDHEDNAFMQGDGVGKPLGILNTNNDALNTVTRAGSGLAPADITGLIEGFYRGRRSSTAWVCSTDAISELMLINGPSGDADYILLDPTSALPMSMFGYPVIYTDKVPGLNSQGDLSLIDFSHYMIIDRMMATIEASDHANFVTNQRAYKVRHRVGGRPSVSGVLTQRNGRTASPFVTLTAAGT